MARLTVMQLLPALDAGGVERGTFEVAEALVRAGHRSIVVSAGGMLVPPLEATGSKHVTLPIGEKSPRVVTTIRRLRRLIETEHVDIVHARSRLPAWMGWLAIRKLDPRPRFVTTLHGLNSVSRYSAIMTRGDRVIAVSEAAMQYWLTHYTSLDAGRVTLIYRGIDPQQFRFGARLDAEKEARFRRQEGIPPERRILTLPGRITGTKGHGDFISLLARLAVKGPDCHGLIIGDFKKNSGVRERLWRRIDALEVADRVTFTGHREDLRGLLSISDIVYCLSTQPESFGRTAAEALAMGRPVIGYDHGGIGEVLARIFPQGAVALGDGHELLDRTRQFLEAPPEVPDEQPFLKSEMQQRTLELYQSLLSEASAR